jgi:hypothetical protein
MHILKILLGSTIIISGFSCSALYGIKPQKKVDQSKINTFYSQLTLKNFQSAVVDSTFITSVKNVLKNDSAQINYHLQPLQAFYFDSKDSLISYHVNCNAGGFPNLQWNRGNVFDVFPPITQTKPTQLFGLNSIKSAAKLDKPIVETKPEYTVVVFWDLMLERQSKRLIDEIEKNLMLTNKKTDLILINNDGLYLEK